MHIVVMILISHTVWDNGGGCMSIIPIPNRKNEFLAVRDFYLKENPSIARLVWGHLVDGEWVIETVIKLPYFIVLTYGMLMEKSILLELL